MTPGAPDSIKASTVPVVILAIGFALCRHRVVTKIHIAVDVKEVITTPTLLMFIVFGSKRGRAPSTANQMLAFWGSWSAQFRKLRGVSLQLTDRHFAERPTPIESTKDRPRLTRTGPTRLALQYDE
jgi:hypothetical protein